MISNKPNDDALYDPLAAGAYIGGTKPIAKQTMAKWRCHGIGPSWVKIQSVVRYRRADLDHWIASNPGCSANTPNPPVQSVIAPNIPSGGL